MKKIQLLLCLVFILNGLNLAKSQNNIQKVNFFLEVNSDNISEIKLKKYNYMKENWQEIKSFKNISSNQKLRFQDKLQEPSLYIIELNSDKKLEIAVEKMGLVEFQIGDEILLKSNIAKITDFKKTIDQLNANFFGSLIKQYDIAIKENDQLTINKLEAKKDEILVQFTAAMEQEVRKMGPSALAYNALNYFDFHKNYNFLKEMTDQFQLAFPNSNMVKSLQTNLQKASRVALGAEAPNFKATDITNTPISLETFKDSYLLIDFWASWCRACRVENPKFAQIYKKHNNNGFNIISISQDTNISTWKKAIEKDGIRWYNIIDTSRSINELYLVSSLPSNILIDRNGKIIAKNINADKLSKLLDKQFLKEAQNK